MEILWLTPLFLLAGWYFSKLTKKEGGLKAGITRIDDKNWIVNNELVSFEEDTPTKRFEQEMEDNKHFHNYERWVMGKDRERLSKMWMDFHDYKYKYPKSFPEITKEELDLPNADYDQYIKMCDKLEYNLRLTKEEFLQKEGCDNKWVFVDLCCIAMPPFVGAYTIYNEKTAKYKDGDMMKRMQEEFEEKWY